MTEKISELQQKMLMAMLKIGEDCQIWEIASTIDENNTHDTYHEFHAGYRPGKHRDHQVNINVRRSHHKVNEVVYASYHRSLKTLVEKGFVERASRGEHVARNVFRRDLAVKYRLTQKGKDYQAIIQARVKAIQDRLAAMQKLSKVGQVTIPTMVKSVHDPCQFPSGTGGNRREPSLVPEQINYN